MESVPGLSSPGKRPDESILSITLVFTGHWIFFNVQYFWLVITDRRIIVLNTSDIRAVSGKSPADMSLNDRLVRLVIPDETSIATRERIRAMQPSAIIAAYPGAVVIPVDEVVSIVLKQQFRYLFTENHSSRWILEITRRDNDGRDTTIRLSAPYYPIDIGENTSVKELFGSRLVAPPQNNYGWS